MDTFGLSATQLDGAGAHWTAREVLQQPQVWAEIHSLIAGEAARLGEFLDPLIARPDVRILLTGAGTSAHIGECLAPALTRTLGRNVEAVPTTDLVASPQSCLSRDSQVLLVSFGRSGSSPESVAAVEVADACVRQCSHLIFACDAEGALYRRAKVSPRSHAVLLAGIPALLVLIIVLLQIAGGVAWLPFVKRWLGGTGVQTPPQRRGP